MIFYNSIKNEKDSAKEFYQRFKNTEKSKIEYGCQFGAEKA